MIRRLLKLNTSSSLFIFGARGTGKSTLIRQCLQGQEGVLWIDLLKEEDEEEYSRKPSNLSARLEAGAFKVVVIDEVQKNVKLLDIVHLEIEKKNGVQFFLSGSSARKLKHGGANLLAGRAFTFHLFPLTHVELGDTFDLQEALEFGTLPRLLELNDKQEISRFLKSYVKTYLREEIVAEQVVRKIHPFQDFLDIAAQMNGKIINFAKIGRDVGLDDKTVKSYYEILCDTLVGFYLQPFHRSIRKRQRESPKFYFFDTGVKRALDNTVNIPLTPKTFEYGNVFEHFVILESFRLNSYYETDYKMSYLRTKDDAEIDLIIERPQKPDLLIEIKSYDTVDDADVQKLKSFVDAWDKPAIAMLLSRDQRQLKVKGVFCLPWDEGILRVFSDTPTV